MDGAEREMDSKGCSFVDSVASDVDRTAMQLDKLLDDSESQPQPAVPASCRGVTLLNTVENIRQELGGDSFPRINDAHFDVRLDTF